jgi:hypothetical protein
MEYDSFIVHVIVEKNYMKKFKTISFLVVMQVGCLCGMQSVSNAADVMQHLIQAGNFKEVKKLVEIHKASPELLVSEYSETPLHMAIVSGNRQIFDYILEETIFGTCNWIDEAAANPDDEDSGYIYENTPLLLCVKKDTFTEDDLYFVHQLLMHGADINMQDVVHKGTALWTTAFRKVSGENRALAELLVSSGADMTLTCKYRHSHRDQYTPGRFCSPYERALRSGHNHIAAFLKEQRDLNLSLVDRLEQETDCQIQKNLYARAIFYEDLDVLWSCMGLMKQFQKKSMIQDVEHDVVKKLIESQSWERLDLVLHQGFYCADEDVRNAKSKLKQFFAGHFYDEDDSSLRGIMTHGSFRINKQVNILKSFVNNKKLSDVLCVFPYEEKKRVREHNLILSAKKTKI